MIQYKSTKGSEVMRQGKVLTGEARKKYDVRGVYKANQTKAFH